MSHGTGLPQCSLGTRAFGGSSPLPRHSDGRRFVDSDFSSLEPSILENAGRTTWDARASVRVTSKVSGQLAIDNLTNRNYQEPLGYYALQRAVRVGVRVAF